MKVEEALAHPYLAVSPFCCRPACITHFQAYHDPSDEPIAAEIQPEFFHLGGKDVEAYQREQLKRE